MTATTQISILLGLAWIIVAVIGIASLVLAYAVGHEYVLTAVGVSRLGPGIGRRLAAPVFAHQGEKQSLRQLVSPDCPTLLLFLGSFSANFSQPRISEVLAPALKEFTALSVGAIRLLIFCIEPGEAVEQFLGREEEQMVIALPADRYDRLARRELGILVAPYAVLVDNRARILAKGLVNNFEHLCWLVVQGGETYTRKVDLEHIIQICDPALPESLRSVTR